VAALWQLRKWKLTLEQRWMLFFAEGRAGFAAASSVVDVTTVGAAAVEVGSQLAEDGADRLLVLLIEAQREYGEAACGAEGLQHLHRLGGRVREEGLRVEGGQEGGEEVGRQG